MIALYLPSFACSMKIALRTIQTHRHTSTYMYKNGHIHFEQAVTNL